MAGLVPDAAIHRALGLYLAFPAHFMCPSEGEREMRNVREEFIGWLGGLYVLWSGEMGMRPGDMAGLVPDAAIHRALGLLVGAKGKTIEQLIQETWATVLTLESGMFDKEGRSVRLQFKFQGSAVAFAFSSEQGVSLAIDGSKAVGLSDAEKRPLLWLALLGLSSMDLQTR